MYKGCSSLLDIQPLRNTSNVVNVSYLCDGCISLRTTDYTNIFNYFESQRVVNAKAMFRDNVNLQECYGLNFLETLEDMSEMFSGCSSLTEIRDLFTPAATMYENNETSNIKNMEGAFRGCTELSNTNLEEILYLCLISDENITHEKSLWFIGLDDDQAAYCITKPEWHLLEAKGWTTGYEENP